LDLPAEVANLSLKVAAEFLPLAFLFASDLLDRLLNCALNIGVHRYIDCARRGRHAARCATTATAPAPTAAGFGTEVAKDRDPVGGFGSPVVDLFNSVADKRESFKRREPFRPAVLSARRCRSPARRAPPRHRQRRVCHNHVYGFG
jgi:hypothetical protein